MSSPARLHAFAAPDAPPSRRLLRAEMSAELARILATDEPYDLKLQQSLTHILSCISAERGSIMMADERGDLVVEAATRSQLIGRVSPKSGGGVGQWVLTHGESLFIDDFHSEERFRAREGAYRTAACLSVPIRDGEATTGVVNVSDKSDGGAFSAGDEVLLNEFLSQAGLFIQHARMRDRLGEQRRVLAEQNEALLRLERTKELLTRMLVHDLKGPLSAVMGNLDLSLYDEELCDDTRELVEASLGSCHTLVQMIMNLLDISRAGEDGLHANVAPHDVVEFVSGVTEVTTAIGRLKEISVGFFIGPDIPPHILLDPALLERTLVNLVMNAVENSTPHSSISVNVDRTDDGDVILSVRDEGPGIPEAELDAIFEVYFTRTASAGRGNHGLGLAFCRMASESQGGRIWVESELGEGSVFRILLRSAVRPKADA